MNISRELGRHQRLIAGAEGQVVVFCDEKARSDERTQNTQGETI
jgi:hypothetical protein